MDEKSDFSSFLQKGSTVYLKLDLLFEVYVLAVLFL